MLEYCSPVWNPHYHSDIEKIESVKCRITKYIGSLNSVSYSERLDVLHADFFLIELRRLTSDLFIVLFRSLCTIVL